jgi:hypothetical protein
MKTEIREIHECNFCGRYYKRKHFAILHEKKCTKNPINFRPCYGCVHLDKKHVGINLQDHYGDDRYVSKALLFCSETNQYLYTPQVSIKGNAFLQEDIEDGEIVNNPMPKKCDQCKDYW